MGKMLMDNLLLLVVFVTGACVLVIEIVALRILSPFFGNTIYSATSVITVILSALSFGYYFGGKLADKSPKEEIFYTIILISGALTYLTQIFRVLILPFFGEKYDIADGPMISGFVLFFLPAFFLGMLSPFAIKLIVRKKKAKNIGVISGQVFFASTVGSIVGSVSTGFFLIPLMGLDLILIAVGTILSLLGVVGLFFSKGKKKLSRLIIIISLSFFSLNTYLTFFTKNKEVLYMKDGIYERIMIFDKSHEGRPARFLYLDRSPSAAVYTDSFEPLFDYMDYYKLYKPFKVKIKNALILGGGGYVIPQAILKDFPESKVDAVEIEPRLFSLSKKYLGIEESQNLNVFHEDGRRFLATTDKKYQYIFSDVYSSLYSIPTHFTTLEFFKLAQGKLSEDGIFIANIIGDLYRRKPSLIFSEMATFSQVFPNSYFFATNSSKNPKSQNIIFLGYKGEDMVSFDEFLEFKKALIDLDRFNISTYDLLTDNRAPTETLSSALINRSVEDKQNFNGDEALAIIRQILEYGSRFLGSPGHSKVVTLIGAEMTAVSDKVIVQNWEKEGFELTNIVARFEPELERRILVGTHFDSKRYADKDKVAPSDPVEGANDSASGVAVLFELARLLANSEKRPDVGVDLAFFDAEEGLSDFGSVKWQPEGSLYFSENIYKVYPNKLPELAIVLDMVCDKNLELYIENNSNEFAGRKVYDFWMLGSRLYPKNFISKVKHNIIDDHTFLNNAGIPSFLVIDFDYPYFHTREDMLAQCSSESLQKVGDVLWEYLKTY